MERLWLNYALRCLGSRSTPTSWPSEVGSDAPGAECIAAGKPSHKCGTPVMQLEITIPGIRPSLDFKRRK
jgi:hypothetical protein